MKFAALDGGKAAALFLATDESGQRRIWATDGTPAGTFLAPFAQRPWKEHRVVSIGVLAQHVVIAYSDGDQNHEARVPVARIIRPWEMSRIWIERSEEGQVELQYVSRLGKVGIERSNDLVEWQDWLSTQGESGMVPLEETQAAQFFRVVEE